MFKNVLKMKILRLNAIIGAIAMLTVGFVTAFAQEHPHEHPTAAKKSEITVDALAKGITDYVDKDSELKGGYFLVYDKQQGKPLALTLQKVHKDRLASLGDGIYFACADFSATDGNIYDVDVFMKGKPDNLKVTDVSIHKKNGESRYDWVEKNGVWTKDEVIRK